MPARIISRLFIAGWFIVLTCGMTIDPAAAQYVTSWSDQVSKGGIFVQACEGFDVTTDYSLDRSFILAKSYSDGRTVERRTVAFAGMIESRDASFLGTLGNPKIGRSYQYDGHLTRTIDSRDGTNVISNLLLRFEVGTPGMFTVTLPRVYFELSESPTSVIRTIVPHTLHMDLCALFAGPPVEDTADWA